MHFPNLFGLMFMGVCLAACGAESSSGSAGGTGGSTTTSASGGGGTGGGCSAPADCPAPTSECQTATCESGACGTANVADDTPASQQTAADCKKEVCEAGAIASKPDDADAGDDGNDCTVDGCDAGSPTTSAEAVGTACNADGGKVCNDSAACVGCNENADCTDPAQPLCAASTCVPIDCGDSIKNGNETDVDCGGLCAPCEDLKLCAIGADCQSGVCKEGMCLVPACDDGVENGNETDIDCGGGTCDTCGPDKGCESGEDCTGNQCTGVGGTCIPNCQDEALDNGESDVDCGGVSCTPCGVGKMCGAADTNCVLAAFCNAGICEGKKTQGSTCGAGNECFTGICVDTVCCGNGCATECKSCNLPGAAGICNLIVSGQDPANECAGNGGADVCNGDGACAKSTGSTCAVNADCATGQCIDGYCCESNCFGICNACSAAKTGQANGMCAPVMPNTDPDNECGGTLTCTGNGCQPSLPNGTVCPSALECASDLCTDGVCCDSTCIGPCVSCNVAGSVGSCIPIPAGQDPDNECAGALSCNGDFGCQKANGGTCLNNAGCASGFCADGVCCNTACPGLCKACNVAGSIGTCSNIPNGQDPANECAGAKFCTGAGVCN